jgi:hypothetical protein
MKAGLTLLVIVVVLVLFLVLDLVFGGRKIDYEDENEEEDEMRSTLELGLQTLTPVEASLSLGLWRTWARRNGGAKPSCWASASIPMATSG